LTFAKNKQTGLNT